VRFFADTNIAAATVAALRGDGHDVVHSAERETDPGDLALLAEAVSEHRVFVTKDHDLGVLVFRDGAAHAGVLLIDDLGSPVEETDLVRRAIASHSEALATQAFVRAAASGVRIGEDGTG
jgi:predicted nuclease of predicted toxin-antitoxin system